MTDITIRSNRPADAPQLRRLSQLDSQPVPAGELIVAEIDGELVAALSPATSRTIADPFRHTAEAVDLLRVRAAGVAPDQRKSHRFGIHALPRFA